MRTVTLTEPGIEGNYVVEGPDEEGNLRLRREPTLNEVLDEMEARPLTQDEFDSRYGHLPLDDELGSDLLTTTG